MLTACVSGAEVYTPRCPRKNQYYRCVEAHFEELERIWDERYQRQYGYWRPYVLDVIYKWKKFKALISAFWQISCIIIIHRFETHIDMPVYLIVPFFKYVCRIFRNFASNRYLISMLFLFVHDKNIIYRLFSTGIFHFGLLHGVDELHTIMLL